MNNYIDCIANKTNCSQAEILQDVLSKFPEKYTLNLFLNELKVSIKTRYNEALLKLTDSDILILKSFYESQSLPFPIIKVSEYEYPYIKHFIRKIEDLNFISNVENIGSKEDVFIEVINLNEMLFTDYLTVDFEYGISVKNEMDKVRTLANLKEEIENYLGIETPQQSKNQKPELNKIWLSEPNVTVSDFLTMGIEKGIWNEQYRIITAKGSLYGTGKSLLGSLFIALKGYAISNNIDYKEAGKAFCNFFNIPISEKVKEPYKAFSSGNEKQIRELKRAFNIK